jgi:hypothetical protein
MTVAQASIQVMKVLVVAILMTCWSADLLAQEQGSRTFSARVVDRTNKEPVLFATVQLEGSALSTLTDEDGVFSLEFPVGRPSENSFMTINYVGYDPMRFRVHGSVKKRLRTIKLRRVKFDLGDPPVIRYGKDGPPPLIER